MARTTNSLDQLDGMEREDRKTKIVVKKKDKE
jgi:hypothetical protein